MKTLINILLIGFVAMTLSGCYHSYEAAKNRNALKLGGEKEKVADVVVEINDNLLLLKNMNTLAESRVKMKETYMIAGELESTLERLIKKLKVTALINQVTLPDELSDRRETLYYQLFQQNENTFDEEYRNLSQIRLMEFQEYLNAKIENPAVPGIRDICYEYEAEVAQIIMKLNEMAI